MYPYPEHLVLSQFLPLRRQTRREGSSKEEINKLRGQENKLLEVENVHHLWILYADPPEHSNFDVPKAPMG